MTMTREELEAAFKAVESPLAEPVDKRNVITHAAPPTTGPRKLIRVQELEERVLVSNEESTQGLGCNMSESMRKAFEAVDNPPEDEPSRPRTRAAQRANQLNAINAKFPLKTRSERREMALRPQHKKHYGPRWMKTAKKKYEEQVANG